MSNLPKQPKIKEIKEGDIYYDEESRILFLKYPWGLEPIKRECDELDLGDEIEYVGIDIEPNIEDVYYVFVLFVRKCSDRYNTNGKRICGFLEDFQWNIAFKMIRDIATIKGRDQMIAAARQGGKSWFLRILNVFCGVFMKEYTYIKEGSFMHAWASPSGTLAKDHYSKMKDLYKAGIDLFNELFPSTPLVTKKEDKSIEQNEKVFVLNRTTITGGIQPWSKFYLISTDVRSKNPGYTLHLLITDESQLMDSHYVHENLIPMLNRTGGCIITAGTTLPDASNLIYNIYKKKTIPTERKFLLDVFQVYESIARRSNEEAQDYWDRFIKEAINNGLNSDYILSQYMVSFEIRGERWVTIEAMENNNLFNIERLGIDKLWEIIVSKGRQDNFYRIASFDSSKKVDFAAMVLGILERKYDSNGDEYYHTYATDFIIVNDSELTAKTMLDPEKMNDRVFSICLKNDIDMIIYEASANQSDRAFYLQKKFNKLPDKKTMTIPIDYGGRNKEKIFLKAEAEIASGKVSLPTLRNTSYDNGYAEFIDELKIFKKTYKGTTIKFASPDSKGLHDDFISAWGQMIYLPYYIEDCKTRGKTAGLGVDFEMNYRIDFYRRSEQINARSRGRVYSYK